MADEKTEIRDFNRRTFIGAVAAVGAGAVLASCKKSISPLTFVDVAPDGPVLKAGLIGCGNRGTGAALNYLKAGPNVKIVAMADVLQDHMDSCRAELAKKAQLQVADDHCFIGFDAYKKVLDSDVDLVICATPPHFRPLHFDAAVEAKKHCFLEKPCAVDAPGIRQILATGQKAAAYNLCVVTGTQRRHDRSYQETYNRVSHGAIGQIVGAVARWNQGQLWYAPKKKEWSDMEAMIRDWVNWRWLSGDHIVEQHVHNLDTVLWFTGMNPTKVIGSGGRAHRVTGDQYDFFNLQFTYPNGGIMESMCRQIDGCANERFEYVVGTEGYTNCNNTIYDLTGKVVWKYQEAGQDPGKTKFNPYDQEHVDLVTAIRTNKPINEAEHVAHATLTAIMGRTAAYTGKEVKWDEMMDSTERLGPTEYAMGPVPVKAEVPVPGDAKDIAKHART
ncbi:MAG: Gfo/Idh/MocA family oxidoreductase [Acidobacteriota bacterium]|nr:Gfo/Idh/MocA family oxidoreductase [Acidobacteriota bacterium]